MSIFSNRMPGAIKDKTSYNLWKFHNDEFHGTVFQVARCADWFTWSPGEQPNARCRLVLRLMHGLPQSHLVCYYFWHCQQTLIEPIVQSLITLFKINMHPLVIGLLTLFIIYLILFLIKTSLIHLKNIIIIIIYFLNFIKLCLLFLTLKRLIPARQSCDWYSNASLLF